MYITPPAAIYCALWTLTSNITKLLRLLEISLKNLLKLQIIHLFLLLISDFPICHASHAL
jgi:hypothetical protein